MNQILITFVKLKIEYVFNKFGKIEKMDTIITFKVKKYNAITKTNFPSEMTRIDLRNYFLYNVISLKIIILEIFPNDKSKEIRVSEMFLVGKNWKFY